MCCFACAVCAEICSENVRNKGEKKDISDICIQQNQLQFNVFPFNPQSIPYIENKTVFNYCLWM